MNKMKPSFANPWFDVDDYLAKGGQLLDVELPVAGPQAQSVFETLLTFERNPEKKRRARAQAKRVGKFLQLMAARVGDQELIGDRLTEDEAIALWRSLDVGEQKEGAS
jgi:hypothetical protein